MELARAWEEAGIETAASGEGNGVRRRHLVMRLFLDGVLVSGPVRGGEHLILDARMLPAAPGVARGELGHDEALALLAARYAWGHGPIDEADLARWTGLTLTEARRALAGALEAGACWGRPLARRGEMVARADLEELTDVCRDEAMATFALPSFDELYVGYKNRACLADAEGERLIRPARNGMFRPIVVAGGRVVAVRSPGGELTFAGAGAGAGCVREAREAVGGWDVWLSNRAR